MQALQLKHTPGNGRVETLCLPQSADMRFNVEGSRGTLMSKRTPMPFPRQVRLVQSGLREKTLSRVGGSSNTEALKRWEGFSSAIDCLFDCFSHANSNLPMIMFEAR